MRHTRGKNNFIIAFILLSVFILCRTTLEANDIDTIDILSQIEETEPEITEDEFFIFPLETQNISSYFGYRRDPINGDRHFHNGVDFSVPIGETVMAAMDGVVSIAVYHQGYGNYITIDHSNGYKTLYSHLSSFSVQQGDVVKRGQKIGETGNTGNSSGPHLHFGMYDVDDKPINPLELLKQAAPE